MRKIFDLCYEDDKSQRLDAYLPDESGFPVFVYFHGGGFKTGDKGDVFSSVLSEFFTKHGIGFVSANYRMYPSAAYPDYLEDGASAVAFVMKKLGEWGSDGRIFVGGSSAGGYLSMMLCYDESYLGRHGITPLDITAFIHDAGQASVHFNVLAERGIRRYIFRVDEAAPIYHVGKAAEYPYQLFFISEKDTPCRREETDLLLKTLSTLKYDTNKFALQYMKGYTHTEYVHDKSEDGESIFGKEILNFLVEKGIM